MKRFVASLSRIVPRAAFLTVALIVGLLFWYLPALMNLDALRPRVTELLEETFHCRVMTGSIDAELFPSVGIIVRHVVFLAPGPAPRVLASVSSVHLWISKGALFHGRLNFQAIRFMNPRFILHRTTAPPDDNHWLTLTLPSAATARESPDIDRWEIRNGRLEIWDHTVSPTSKWVVDRLNGQFREKNQSGMLTGAIPALGPSSLMDIHYEGLSPDPIEAHVTNVNLLPIRTLLHFSFPLLKEAAAIDLKIRLKPAWQIKALVRPSANSGVIHIEAERQANAQWQWSTNGKDAVLPGTDFRLPLWSAQGDSKGARATIQAETNEGGSATILWEQPHGDADASLNVAASSVTVRQILEIFDLQSHSEAAQTPSATFHPNAYESWRIQQGSMTAVLHPRSAFQVLDSTVDIEGMHLRMQGRFGTAQPGDRATIQGTVENISLAQVLESFFSPPAVMTGTGRIDFNLNFPLSHDWIEGLNGPLQIQVAHGVLRRMKTIYRVTSVLNLTNYLRLRIPQVTAEGVLFESVTGHIVTNKGVMSSEDLFLKSSNFNIGARGAVDLPAKRVQATLRIEMLRFLEDILRDVPITHWIFKKPNKILLPLLVALDGPWENIDVH